MISRGCARAVWALALAAGCTGGDDGAGGHIETAPHPLCERAALCDERPGTGLTIAEPVTVAPSDAMPPEVVSQLAHNNLDVAWHDDGEGGRLFFAFRTGPFHFASPDVVMYVVSSADLKTWRFEGSFALGTDLREPQLVSIGGKLLFYFVELGANRADFEPRGVHVTEWLGPGRFSELADIFTPGFLVWRIKPLARPGERLGEWVYAFGYDGGENVYDNDGEPIRVKWLRSRDGLAWEPVDPAREVVLEGGASETDAVFMDDGRVIAVARNEAGDASGFGSKICRGEAGDPAAWTCASDKRKLDSPLVFRHGDEVWAIARRNVTEDGRYDLDEDELPMADQYRDYQFEYWTKPKRCALWRIDPVALTATWQADLPSAGDTCFPEAITLSSNHLLVFDYSSPTDGATDPTWSEGQLGPTHVYWTVVTLP